MSDYNDTNINSDDESYVIIPDSEEDDTETETISTTSTDTISEGDTDTTLTAESDDTISPVTIFSGDETIPADSDDTILTDTTSEGDTDTVTISPVVTISTEGYDTTSGVITIVGGDNTTAPFNIAGDVGDTVPIVVTYGSSTATIAATVTTADGDTDDLDLTADVSFIGNKDGDTIINAPVIVDSIVEGGIGNTNYVTINNFGNIETTNNYFTYTGGYQSLQDYTQDQVIQLASDYKGIDLYGDTFVVKSSSGQLEIRNSRDKYISYSGTDGRVVAYSYFASEAGRISGQASKSSQSDILIGADNKDNRISSGSGNSSLWGGDGQSGNDTLVGGGVYTEFFYALNNGEDVIKDAKSTDLVNLASVRLSQIIRADVSLDEVTIRFTDGGSLRVQGNASGMSYQIAEGTFSCNQYNGKWTPK